VTKSLELKPDIAVLDYGSPLVNGGLFAVRGLAHHFPLGLGFQDFAQADRTTSWSSAIKMRVIRVARHLRGSL
jgi:hypothetical protein